MGEDDVDAAIREVNDTPSLMCKLYLSLFRPFPPPSLNIVIIETDPLSLPFSYTRFMRRQGWTFGS